MNLLIVDDEPLARAELLRLCGELIPGFSGTEAATLTEARAAMLREDYDGIFVDMELSGSCGLDLLPDARASGTPVVVSTAHERFAVDAFGGEVMDYLLKPVELSRLFRAIAKISRHRKSEQDELILEADGSYCVVKFTDRKPLTVSRSLKEMEQMFVGLPFIRANRSQIVNLRQIQVIHRQGTGRMLAELDGQEEIEFSRRQAQAFRSRFSI